MIPKSGKLDYSKVRAYWVISLLDVVSKLVERAAAHLIADHLECGRGLYNSLFGCRKRHSYIDAVALLITGRSRSGGEARWQGRCLWT